MRHTPRRSRVSVVTFSARAFRITSRASGGGSAVTGGGGNTASGTQSSVSGGGGNVAILDYKEAESCLQRVKGFKAIVEEHNRAHPDRAGRHDRPDRAHPRERGRGEPVVVEGVVVHEQHHRVGGGDLIGRAVHALHV